MTINVLIVEDSLTVRMDLAEAFTAGGCHAFLAESGASAWRIFEAEPIDVAILDVVLPDTDGIALLRRLRDHAKGPALPVLMLSSESEVRDRILGLRTGADEYVGKPYDRRYVVARALELVRSRRVAVTDQRPILIIDDSLTFRAMLTDALQQEGYSVVVAGSGEDGLRLAAQASPRALLVDGVLSGINGATVIRRVRLDAVLRGMPCILMTAAAEVDAELQALDSGADAFIRKGEDAGIILAKLGAILRNTSSAPTTYKTASLQAAKRILAVDDSRTYREHVAQALRDEGYDVVLASSGEQALELLAVQAVDCVLLDLVMPGIGGKETCIRIKATPEFRDLPVVLLTALEDRESMIEGLAMGADDYIEKSAELAVLKARVRAQLRRRQFEEETRRVREQLLRSEIEASQARSSRALAETRALLVQELEHKNRELSAALRDLRATQGQLVHSAKMASLGELVAGVAHEINNPLAFVISHLETARKNLQLVAMEVTPALSASGGERWTRAIARLDELPLGLERIRDLVVKLRTFSRLDEGERKRVSIRESVESLLTILSHRTRDRIVVETRFGTPDMVDCYPSLLTQAVMNLVSNAIDAIEGTGTITIQSGADGPNYMIAVADTGSGISDNVRDRIFDPFFTTKPVGQGTGLGLSITDSIVRRHGGSLSLTPASPTGTVATIRIPMEHT